MDDAESLIEEARRIEETAQLRREEAERCHSLLAARDDAFAVYREATNPLFDQFGHPRPDPSPHFPRLLDALRRVCAAYAAASLRERWNRLDRGATLAQYRTGWADPDRATLAFRYGCLLLDKGFDGTLDLQDIAAGWASPALRGCFGQAQLLLDGIRGYQLVQFLPDPTPVDEVSERDFLNGSETPTETDPPPDRWSAGTFLAKAKELQRRLRFWHYEDFRSPVQFSTMQEARQWVRRTFRDFIRPEMRSQSQRPSAMQFWTYEPGPDEQGFVGEACINPERDTDRSLTQWLLGDFWGHLDAASPLPALDCLRETFDQLLALPAWTVCEPPPPMRGPTGNPRCLMVTGLEIPQDRLASLVDAAERLLATAPHGWVTPPAPQESPSPEPSAASVEQPPPASPAPPAKPKRSTARGDAREKIIPALTKHHRYADGGCLNGDPIGVNELARQAGVAPASVSLFFAKEFNSHSSYQAACRDISKLVASLKLLNDEFTPRLLLGDSAEREADEDDLG